MNFIHWEFTTVHFFDDGFQVVENFIPEKWIDIILQEVEQSEISTDVSGVRNINKKLSCVSDYLQSEDFKEKSNSFISADAKLVRAILFNKSPQSNWYVTWHQDKTVSVSEQFEGEDWRAWSIKEDILHVQPPLQVLETMVTIRVHLDATPKENGCLKVIPNSHLIGILSTEAVTKIVTVNQVFYCEAEKGSALIMRPLLLHASSKSVSPANRRVLHFEFSSWQLPEGIFWS